MNQQPTPRPGPYRIADNWTDLDGRTYLRWHHADDLAAAQRIWRRLHVDAPTLNVRAYYLSHIHVDDPDKARPYPGDPGRDSATWGPVDYGLEDPPYDRKAAA